MLRFLLLPLLALLLTSVPPGAAVPPPETAAAAGVPPIVILATRPALLVQVDGPPRYLPVKGVPSPLWRVANTRVLLLKTAAGRHYLRLYDGFMEAEAPEGPWRVAEKVPAGVRFAEQAARSAGKANLLEGKPDPKSRKRPSLRKGAPPWIHLATVPTELVVTDGPPDFIAIEGTRLFYARNTAADLFWRQGEPALYLLAAGRWYRAASYGEPWEPLSGDLLPPDFREIPETSVKRRVKRAVPTLTRPVPHAPVTIPPGGWVAPLFRGDRRPGAFQPVIAPPTPAGPWCPWPRE